MADTCEGINKKIINKLSQVRFALGELRPVVAHLRALCCGLVGKKYLECIRALDRIGLNLTLDMVSQAERDYNLSVVTLLSEYYSVTQASSRLTQQFCNVVAACGIVERANDLLTRVRSAINVIVGVLSCTVMSSQASCELLVTMGALKQSTESSLNISVSLHVEKYEFTECECGERMHVMSELSEMHCTACGIIERIQGTVFGETSGVQEGGRTGRGGYDTSRHYKFWIERLQALESTVMEESYMQKIDYILRRDSYDRRRLTCEDMRLVLKDPKVDGAHLNDHAPLLVKLFGGPAPPQLDFQESRDLSVKFNVVMKLYDVCVSGGNKPYYPYFIYKLIEIVFKDKPDKLKLLNYIHLQSRDTVVKNDLIFKQICGLAKPADGLVYMPTTRA